jgi:ubiquitin-conjugating enzyme E2 variant
MAIALIIIKVFFIYLLADFATGIFHFYADNYGEMDGKFLTNSVNLLLIHHIEPEKIATQNYWELTGGVYKFSFIIFPISLMLLGFHWEILLFLIISAQANIVHKWSHSSNDKTPVFAKVLQKINLIQNKRHHQNHHMANFHKNYCVMTPYVNPFLENFFSGKG